MSDAGNISNTNNPSKKLKISSSMATPPPTSLNTGDDNDGKDDFQILREYILKCPHLGSDSPAIKAALEGMEKEEKRRIRDAKLRSKFGGSGSSNTSNSTKSNNNNHHDGDNEIVVVEKDVDDEDAFILEGTSNSNSNDEDMEWQDVPPKDVDEDDDGVVNVPAVRAIGDSFSMEDEAPTATTAERESCFLGKTLAKACIDAIASQQQHQRHKPVVVSTPLAAIAVALHVSLRSDILGFRCTGIPEDAKVGTAGKTKNIGFAPPIRELPKTEFLPRGWDQSSSSSPEPLRYRKADTGAVILTVVGLPSKEDDGTSNSSSSSYCRVTFGPANRKQHDPSACPSLEFPLAEHMNLDSWNAAAKATGGAKKIPPSLHYKNLSGLLSKFCRTFDLGAVETNSNNNNTKSNSDSMMGAYDTAGMGRVTKIAGNGSNSVNNSSSKMEASGVFGSTMESRPARGYTVPSTLDQAFPSAAAASRRLPDPRLLVDPPNHGDFSGDLLPAGLHDPRFAGGRVGMGMGGTGNLMGPNHPMFAPDGSLGGTFPGHLGGGPGRMQPRFDPIVPPCLGGGGPPNPNGHPNRNRNQRRTPGEPNPDHLPPPNSLGDSMFM